MRLLEFDSDGKIRLKDFPPNKVPRYAILSHTWDNDEVTFKDVVDGVEKKQGHKKIAFCGDQASRDGLQYFWVDTCCIDKSSSAELQESINSMFRWYRNAAKCYVYLSDVSSSAFENNDKSNQLPYESAFRQSRWFTRGWTLQELLAPASVEFFSEEGMRLGDKKSLERQIHEITGIPVLALQGTPLYQFRVNERFIWAHKRETTCEEDWAYSLLGIFDAFMPLIYGEGRERAVIRLRKEIYEASKVKTLESHSGSVRAVAFSPDSKQLASASDDTVRLWDVASGAPLYTFENHSGGGSAVAFLLDGKQLASASYRTVRLWDTASGALLHTLEGHSGKIMAVVFSLSLDGKQLASASYHGTVRLRDTASGALLHTLGRLKGVRAVAFSPDGKQLASASYHDTVKLWDTGSGTPLYTLKDSSHAVVFSPDGKQLASHSYNNVSLWPIRYITLF